MTKTIGIPAGFIDPVLAGTTELETFRAGMQAASGSLGATLGREMEGNGSADGAVAAAQHLSRLLDPHAAQTLELRFVVHGPNGERFELVIPGAWSAGMFQELAVLLSGNSVTWQSAPHDMGRSTVEVGTSEVASILGVSIPTAKKVLDRGQIPSRMTPGGHRRVLREDAQAWRAKRDQQRTSLHELARLSELDERDGRALPSNVTEDPDDES